MQNGCKMAGLKIQRIHSENIKKNRNESTEVRGFGSKFLILHSQINNRNE